MKKLEQSQKGNPYIFIFKKFKEERFMLILKKILLIILVYSLTSFHFAFSQSKKEIKQWEKCQRAIEETTEFTKTTEIYKNFIKEHPNSFFIKDAYEYIAQIYYEKAIREDEADAFEFVMNNYSNTKSAQASLRKIYVMKYKIVESQNTIPAYQDYINKYPESFLISEAKENLTELEFERAVSLNTLEGYQTYIKKYPKSIHKEKVIKSIDDLALEDFNQAKQMNTIKAFENFKNKYPHCSFAAKANLSIKKIIWSKIKTIRTIFRGHTSEFEEIIKKKLEKVGFTVVPENNEQYDATLNVSSWRSSEKYIIEEKDFFEYYYLLGKRYLKITLWHPLIGTIFRENYYGKTEVDKEQARTAKLFVEVEKSALSEIMEDPDFRFLEYHILGSLQNSQCVEPIINILLEIKESAQYDSYWGLRYKYVEYLGEIGSSRAIEGLIAALYKIKNSSILKKIMETLSNIGKPAVKPLLEKLKQKNLPHYFTFQALANIGDRKAVGILVEYLEDKDVKNRMHAASALGKIGESSAIGPLSKALEDEDVSVRENAALALAKLKWKNIQEFVIKSSFKPEVKIEILSELGDSIAVNTIIDMLSNANTDVRKKAVDALSKIKDKKSINSLIKSLRDEDEDVAEKAARTLIQMKNNITNEQIELMIEEFIVAIEEESDRDAFYSVFEEISETIDKPLLINLLNHSNSNVRISAAYLLGRLKIESALNPLIQKLNAADPEERQAAIRALARINDPRACMPLMAAINDADYYTRRAVINSCKNMKEPRTVWPLIQLLEKVDKLADSAAWILGDINDSRAVDALINKITHGKLYKHGYGRGKDHSKEYAVKSLRQIGDERAIDLFIELLDKKYLSGEKAYEYAVLGLGDFGSKKAVNVLIKTLNSFDYDLARIAALSLGKIGDATAVPALINALDKPKLYLNASRSLSMIKDPRAIPPLIKAFKEIDSNYGRIAIPEALSAFKDIRVVDFLSSYLEDDSYLTRKHAILALGKMSGFDVVSPLAQTLQNDENWINDEILLAITTSLKEISNPEAIESLKLILKNSDNSEIRQLAKGAVEAITK